MKISRYIYFGMAWLFVIGVAVQVFLAGLVVVGRTGTWAPHTALGHILLFPLVLMLITQYTGRLPRSVKNLTWVLVVVYLLQADVVIFLRLQAPVVSALHPVLALIEFALDYSLARKAWPLVRQAQAPDRVQSEMDASTVGR